MLITKLEFEQIERLLGALLPHCDKREETLVLHAYARIKSLWQAQSQQRSARDHLLACAERGD